MFVKCGGGWKTAKENSNQAGSFAEDPKVGAISTELKCQDLDLEVAFTLGLKGHQEQTYPAGPMLSFITS